LGIFPANPAAARAKMGDLLLSNYNWSWGHPYVASSYPIVVAKLRDKLSHKIFETFFDFLRRNLPTAAFILA
jgi:hypothetical protein